MARDLIPPPSPAGRPAPDPEHPPVLLPAEPDAARAAEPAAPPGPSAFRARFGFVLGALAGCAVAAAVLLVVLISGDGKRTSPGPGTDEGLAADWSPWKPHTSGTIAGAEEIAKEIEGNYKDAKAKKLTKVKGGPIALNTLPISVAIPSAGDRFTVVGGVGIQYVLSGFGKEGRLKGSEPSAERRRLLRREALELSLYSFRYLPEVTMVVALLPPAPKTEQFHPKPKTAAARAAAKARKPEPYQRQALFYRPGDLRKQLKRPLELTMATEPPKIDALTRPRGQADRRPDALEPLHLRAHPAAGRQPLPGARPPLVARAGGDGHARVLVVARIVLRAQAHRELGTPARPYELLMAAGVTQAGRRPGRHSPRRWPRRASSSWCCVTRCLTGSPSGRAWTMPHMASATCSARSGVARARISSTSASSSRSIFASALPSPSERGKGTPGRWSSQAPFAIAKRLRSAIGSVIGGASVADADGPYRCCACTRSCVC